MAWSTEQVYSTTLERLKEAALDYALLPRLRDLDNREDLDHYRRQGMQFARK